MRPFSKVIEECGLDYSREIRKFALIALVSTVLCALLIIVFGKLYLFAFLPLIVVVVIISFSRHYTKLKERRLFRMQKEFVKLFTYFETFVSNGLNVYKSLEMLGDYCSTQMRSLLDVLLCQIDEDKTVMPFVRFARRFNSLIIEQAMVCIFQLIDQGNSDGRLNQFLTLFDKIADQHYLDNTEKIHKKLDSLNLFPLLGAGLITIMITFGIISLIGGIVNGI